MQSKSEFERESRKVAKEEIEKTWDDWSQKCTYHGLAICFAVLHKEFGFGADRLKRLHNGVLSELHLLEHGFLGKKYDESDIRKWLLSIGIDFEKE